MMTILDCLKGVNAYPVQLNTFLSISAQRGVDTSVEASADILKSKEYRLSVADLYMWLSYAPNVTQANISYSFTDEQRDEFRRKAGLIYDELEDEEESPKINYGYKGSRH